MYPLPVNKICFTFHYRTALVYWFTITRYVVEADVSVWNSSLSREGRQENLVDRKGYPSIVRADRFFHFIFLRTFYGCRHLLLSSFCFHWFVSYHPSTFIQSSMFMDSSTPTIQLFLGLPWFRHPREVFFSGERTALNV